MQAGEGVGRACVWQWGRMHGKEGMHSEEHGVVRGGGDAN